MTCDICQKTDDDGPIDWTHVTNEVDHLHACSPNCTWKLEKQLGTAG